MFVAVIYTGELRTIDKTISHFKENIILNDNYHVFATLQNPENEIIKNNHEEKLIKELKDNLKSLIWLSKNDENYEKVLNKIINKNEIPEHYKNYLKYGGSIIEHYQSYLNSEQIKNYEEKNKIKYDYVLRIRTDVILTNKIDFNFLSLPNEEIMNRLISISNRLKIENIFDTKCLTLFMNSLLDVRRIYIDNLIDNNNILTNDNFIKIDTIEKLKNYIECGSYIITLRKNVFFLIKRDNYSLISNLGISYGDYKKLYYNNHYYWWDSESQLQSICYENNIDIFNSTTSLEDLSLYDYENKNYFDNDDKLLNKNDLLFFICRN